MKKLILLFYFIPGLCFGQADLILGKALEKLTPQLVTNSIMESSAISMQKMSASMNMTLLAIETDQKVINEAMKKIYAYEKEFGSMNAAISQFLEDRLEKRKG